MSDTPAIELRRLSATDAELETLADAACAGCDPLDRAAYRGGWLAERRDERARQGAIKCLT